MLACADYLTYSTLSINVFLNKFELEQSRFEIAIQVDATLIKKF